MKTVMEWLEQAKAEGYPWADAAIANCDTDVFTLNRPHSSLSTALCAAFAWDESSEGYEFWREIVHQLLTPTE